MVIAQGYPPFEAITGEDKGMFICMSVWLYVMCVSVPMAKGEVTVMTGAGNRTCVLWKSTKHPQLRSISAAPSTLLFEKGALTKPRVHCFSWTNWPTNPQDVPVSVPSSGTTNIHRHSCLLREGWGSKLGSSCSCSRGSARWAISRSLTWQSLGYTHSQT